MESDIQSEFLSGFDEARYPGEFALRYEAMECLSSGKNGETLLVREKESGRLLVAKCYEISSDLFESTEPEQLRTLSHPGLPSFRVEYRSETMRCILREYVPGRTLCETEGGFTEETVRRIGLGLCRILGCLHGQTPPVIHRDIKPQNVVIGDDGEPVLIDLGISRLYAQGAGADTLFCGTQDFAPPEQYGFLQTDCRSDIYSLGILLAWMLNAKASPIRQPETPLERVIAKCTAFAPEKRYKNAAAAERALLRTRPVQRRKKRILLGTVVLAVLVAAVFFLPWRPGAESASAYAGADAPASISQGQTAQSRFKEPLIEEAVRLMLGKDADEPLSDQELLQVTELYITRNTPCADIGAFYETHEAQCRQDYEERGTISSLEDLRLLPNLRVLCLASQQVEDLSPLAALSELFQLELRRNAVSDLAPLEGLENLKILGLNSNPVTDLAPLSRCGSLRNLDLCDANSYKGSDLALLGDMDFLDISNGTDSYLYLGGKTIRELKVSGTALTDLSFLEDVTGLERLEICRTGLTDISPLEGQTALISLKLTGISSADFSVLLKLPALETVTVGAEMKDALAAAAAQGAFTVTYE